MNAITMRSAATTTTSLMPAALASHRFLTRGLVTRSMVRPPLYRGGASSSMIRSIHTTQRMYHGAMGFDDDPHPTAPATPATIPPSGASSLQHSAAHTRPVAERRFLSHSPEGEEAPKPDGESCGIVCQACGSQRQHWTNSDQHPVTSLWLYCIGGRSAWKSIFYPRGNLPRPSPTRRQRSIAPMVLCADGAAKRTPSVGNTPRLRRGRRGKIAGETVNGSTQGTKQSETVGFGSFWMWYWVSYMWMILMMTR